MSMPAAWCLIISRVNSSSAVSPVAARRAASSAFVAIPGILSTGMPGPIQSMTMPSSVEGAFPASPRRPFMMATSCDCDVMTSRAMWPTSSSFVGPR